MLFRLSVLFIFFACGGDKGTPAEEGKNPEGTSSSQVKLEPTLGDKSDGLGDTETKERVISFGIVPQQAPSQILKNWQPFADEMSRRTGMKWVVKTAPSIPEFEKRCLDGRYDVAYMNPYHYTVFAQKPGYRAFARQKNKRIKGILVVRKDDPVQSVEGLKNYPAAFPSPAAFAASVITRAFLKNSGIPVEIHYSNSHDSVYQNVAKGIQKVGGGVLRTWRATDKKVRDQLRILWTSPAYTPHAFAFHSRLDAEVVKVLTEGVAALASEARIATVFDPIKFKGIMTAEDADWDDVRALKITTLDHLLKGASAP